MIWFYFYYILYGHNAPIRSQYTVTVTIQQSLDVPDRLQWNRPIDFIKLAQIVADEVQEDAQTYDMDLDVADEKEIANLEAALEAVRNIG